MAIRTVGVVGAGLMGSGIIENTAREGYDVVAREVDDAALQGGQKRVAGSMGRGIERGKLTESDRDQANARITWTTNLQDLKTCDLVIESIIENLPQKKDL